MENELILFKILHRIIRGWPASYDQTNGGEKMYERINTMAIVQSEEQMYSENLAKDARYKPTENPELFFSRSWDENEYKDDELKKTYPALMLWDDQNLFSDMNTQFPSEKITIRGCIQDFHQATFDPGDFNPTDGRQRPIELIKANLRKLRMQLIRELQKWEKVDAIVDGQPETQWHNREQLTNLISSGAIDGYDSHTPLFHYLNIDDDSAAIVSNFNSTGMVHAYFSMTLTIYACDDVQINHETNVNGEQLDHKTKASA